MINETVARRSIQSMHNVICELIRTDGFNVDNDRHTNVGFLSMVVESLDVTDDIIKYMIHRGGEVYTQEDLIYEGTHGQDIAIHKSSLDILSTLDASVLIRMCKLGICDKHIGDKYRDFFKARLGRYEEMFTYHGVVTIDNDIDYAYEEDCDIDVREYLAISKNGEIVSEDDLVELVGSSDMVGGIVRVNGSYDGVSIRKPIASIITDGIIEHILTCDYDTELSILMALVLIIYDTDEAGKILSVLFDDDVFYYNTDDIRLVIRDLIIEMKENNLVKSHVGCTYILSESIKIMKEVI